MKKQCVEIHNFLCLNCGGKTPLARKIGKTHDKFHRKVLYCPYCGCTVNHAECRNEIEELEFAEKFTKGEFNEEAAESIEFYYNKQLLGADK